MSQYKTEKAVFVGVVLEKGGERKVQEYLDELQFLAETAGAVGDKMFMQRMDRPDKATYIGTGKLQEIKEYCVENEIQYVIFDDELTGTQQRNIEKVIECSDVIDRTSLILEIFAQRAKTSYAKMQVELAHYQYMLPRLTGMWTHLERQRGGMGTRGGMGETQIEVDRRIVKQKITKLKEDLKKVDRQMATQRSNRGSLVRLSWMIVPKTGTAADTVIAKYHYKKCKDCGQIVYDTHKWATYSSDWGSHNQRCLVCDYVIEASHKNFGKQQIPVDEYYHMIYCDSCGFLKKLRHEFGDDRMVTTRDCEHTVVKYRCKQCYHVAYFEEPGAGHDYDDYGICRRQNCLHPFQQPDVEPLDTPAGDSTFVVRTFGNLYWIADYVNNRRPKTNVRLANDLIADGFMRRPWKPIGATDSTAFQGTFDGGGHVITMLQTEEPVAGCGPRGLFGAVAKEGTVRHVTLAACNMRGWDCIGGVAGINAGVIDHCHVAFSIMNSIATGLNLGGICGLNRGTISSCTTQSDVWVGAVRDYAGGICGTNDGGSLSNNTTAAICGSGSDAVLPETASEI